MANHTTQFVTKNYSPLVDNFSILIFTYITYTAVCQVLNTFGVFSNIINIVCFVKQGFKEPINISLVGLAISDIGCNATSFIINVMVTPAMSEADLPFVVHEMVLPVAAIPHLIFISITSWITAVITIERCLCVVVPLKVKQMITPRRMLVIVASVYIILISSGVPIYFVKKLGMKFVPSRNRTLLGFISITDGDYFRMIYYTLNSVVVPCLAFIIISVCTVVLVYYLHKQTQWRNASTTSSVAKISTRSHNVAKIVVMISALYISCTIPITITMLALAFEPRINWGGPEVNLGMIVGGFGVIAESINPSANIFIYYRMSSKFKEEFLYLSSKIYAQKL